MTANFGRMKHPISIDFQELSNTIYEKEYNNVYDNMMKNQYNRMSYFYIRNGENLYRVWANLYIPHSV